MSVARLLSYIHVYIKYILGNSDITYRHILQMILQRKEEEKQICCTENEKTLPLLRIVTKQSRKIIYFWQISNKTNFQFKSADR